MVRKAAKKTPRKQPPRNTRKSVAAVTKPVSKTPEIVTSDDGRSSSRRSGRSKDDGAFFSAVSEFEDAVQSADDTALSTYEIPATGPDVLELERPVTRSSTRSSGSPSVSNWSDDNLSTIKRPTKPVSRRPVGRKGKSKDPSDSESSNGDISDDEISSDSDSDGATANLSVVQKFMRNSRKAARAKANGPSTSNGIGNANNKKTTGRKRKSTAVVIPTTASSEIVTDEDDPPPKRQQATRSNRKNNSGNRRTLSDAEQTFRTLDDEVDEETKFLFGRLMECVRSTDERSRAMDTKVERIELRTETIDIKLDMLMSYLAKKNKAEFESDNKDMPDLPIRHMYDMDKMEILLRFQKNFTDLETKLSRLPSKDIKDMTRRILEKLFHYKVAARLNWAGKNDQKLPIKNLKITEVIIAAAFKKYEDADAQVVTHAIQQWLKDAPARDRRRKRVD